MKRYSAILFLLTLITVCAQAQTYTLVWSDEFDSTAVNQNEWQYEVNGDGGGNNELQYYTSFTKNSSINAGIFTIKALKEFYLNRSYTSARLHTKKSWQYGKIEARIKLPYGKGIWPAFWMLGSNISSVGWPSCGEIDIMEMIGGPTTASGGDGRVFGTAHWNSGGHAQYGLSYALSSGKLSDDYHLYTIVWDATKIVWYFDNAFYCIISTTPAGLNAFRAPFFIILNLAVGGNWPGAPDGTTTFPQQMDVDYVRVYQNIPTSVKENVTAPNGFSLEQNYPNPFNPTTVIQYSVSEHLPGFQNLEGVAVLLKIYDVLGNEIATLVNEHKMPGNYSVQFDAASLPGGVYFYRLQSGGFVSVKKMQLLK